MVAQASHFFKVVRFPSEQGLKIPCAFMRKFGGDLKENVSLKVPNGPSWPVEIVHYGDGTLLKKGWQEFAEFYSIKIFHFLVFRYEGNSRFQVQIFDPTCLEIEYPSQDSSNRSDEDVIEEEKEEIFKSYQTTTSMMRPRTTSDFKIKTKSTYSESTKKVVGCFVGTGSSRKIDKEKFQASQEAKAFRSSRPFFISFIKPSYVSLNFQMNIPNNFMKDHLSMIEEDCHFMLRISGNSRKWPAILKVFYDRMKIGKGFKNFVQDNNVKVGDVCVFELGLCSREFKITLYRSADNEMVS